MCAYPRTQLRTHAGEAAPANRALQLWRWMYADPTAASGGQAWIRSLDETAGRQNGFSKKFIDKVGWVPPWLLAGNT